MNARRRGSSLNLIARFAHSIRFRLSAWRDARLLSRMGRALAAGSKHHEAPTPTRLDKSLATWQAAIVASDGGRLMDAADLYASAISESGYINGVVRTVSEGIPGLPHTFVGPPALVRALEGVKGQRRGIWGDIFPDSEKSKMLAFGLGIGVCVMQRVPVPDDCAPLGQPRTTFKMRAWHPRVIRYDMASDRVAIRTWGGEVWLDEHTDEFCLFLPYGDTKPWELAPWKYTVRAYLLSRDAEFDRSRHSALNGPAWWFQGGEETTPQNLKDADKMMAEMERNPKMTFQRGESLNVTAPPAGDLSSVYGEILTDARGEVEIGWLGNRVLTNGTGGSLGATGEMWERMTARRIDYAAAALERFEQCEVLDYWAPAQVQGARVGILYDTRPPSEREAPAKSASGQPANAGQPLSPTGEAKDQDIQVEPDAVLNGAQIAAAVDIVVQVTQGTLPRASGLRLLETGFNLTPQKALEIMGNAGLGGGKVAA